MLPKDHKCHRLHGHNYIVRLVLESAELDSVGFVVDYGDLSDFGNWVDDMIDHRNLNDVCPLHTSAENVARWMFDHWKPEYPALAAVMVSETPKVWAEYRP